MDRTAAVRDGRGRRRRAHGQACRVRRWHSGDGVVKTLRATGEVTREGKPRGKILSLRFGVAFRDTYESEDGLRSDDGFTGNVSWTSNANGFTVRPVGSVVKSQYDVDALFGEYTATAAFTPAFVKSEKVDGVDCAVVRLTSQVGFPLDVYIDPATGAYRRAVVDPDGAYEYSVEGLAYALVDGKRFLSAWHHGKSKVRYAFTSITPNAPIRRPQPRHEDAAPDRHDVMATFDSGSPSDIIFSKDLVKRDHVAFKSLGSTYIAGIGGAESAECGKLPPVTLGPVRYEAHWACALESFPRSEILLGLDFMRAFNFVFDYPDGLIVMMPRKHY
jgi:hypothetical protein